MISPLGDRGYLASKVVTLSLLAVVTSTLVAVLGHGPTPQLGVLIIGVGLSASLFVLIGFVAVARYDSVNEYFLSAVGWGTVLFLRCSGISGSSRLRCFTSSQRNRYSSSSRGAFGHFPRGDWPTASVISSLATLWHICGLVEPSASTWFGVVTQAGNLGGQGLPDRDRNTGDLGSPLDRLDRTDTGRSPELGS